MKTTTKKSKKKKKRKKTPTMTMLEMKKDNSCTVGPGLSRPEE